MIIQVTDENTEYGVLRSNRHVFQRMGSPDLSSFPNLEALCPTKDTCLFAVKITNQAGNPADYLSIRGAGSELHGIHAASKCLFCVLVMCLGLLSPHNTKMTAESLERDEPWIQAHQGMLRF